MLVRHTHPTKFEVAPYGTIWKEIDDENKNVLFIQLGKDGGVNWVKMGDFLEGIFEGLMGEEEFIEGCMYLHEGKGTREEKELISGLGAKLERIGERKM
jgi:hypothetical protein